MCRFALYLGPEIRISSLTTEPEYSIIRQSYKARERDEPLNGDGFGLAWYPARGAGAPALFKDVSPAWNNFNLRQIAPVVRSSCILAHVRASTLGLPVTQYNCHPFAWRSFAMAHNGTVGGFPEIKRRLISRLSEQAFRAVLGSTDSEHVFALFIDAFNRSDDRQPSAPKIERMAAALRSSVETVEELRREAGVESECCSLNLALADGKRAVVSRYTSRRDVEANSLYVQTGRRYVCQKGICRMIADGEENGAVVVSSEPLSAQCCWREVPPDHMAIVEQDRSVRFAPLLDPDTRAESR